MTDASQLRILLTDDATEVGHELVEDHLFVSVGIQSTEGVAPMTTTELTRLGLSPHRAMEIAMARLRRTSEPDDLRVVDTLPGLRFLKVGDGLAASRIAVLPELMKPLPLGGVVVAVPEPSQLLCVPVDSARAIDGLQALASAVGHLEATRDDLLSDQLFWFDGRCWRAIPVHHGEEDITVLPPPDFLSMMSRVASMDWVQVAGEA
ncbi:MAG: hypothetical protein KTR31_05395 [Myxococcales bacterium]|nr:hypothetical protein [Myxococcales bacterium]